MGAICGTYEGVIERFGPFGVLPECRGTGLGKLLLHLTLDPCPRHGAHSAVVPDGRQAVGGRHVSIWVAGFSITRTFHHPLA